MAGGGARGAIDNFEGLFEDGRKRERVIETVILNFAVNGGVTACDTLRRIAVSENGSCGHRHGLISPNREREREREKSSVIERSKLTVGT